MAWLVSRQLLKSGRKLRGYLFDLLDAKTLVEQRALYEKSNPPCGAGSAPGCYGNRPPWRCWACRARKSA